MLEIKLEKFSGPLDLLLQMIQKEKMDITEIDLAKITDEYLDYIARESISADEVSDFLVIAARLILIKSRALLPCLYQEQDEETDEFTANLKMYKEFLEASVELEKIIGKKQFMFTRIMNIKSLDQAKFFPPKNLGAKDLGSCFEYILQKLNKEIEPKLEDKKIEKEIHIEDKILEIRAMILKKIKLSFNKMIKKAQSKTEVVVSLLSLLELMKQREVYVTQGGLFEEIEISNPNLNNSCLK